MSVIEVIKAIEEQTKKEVQYISFYKTGEVKELTFTKIEWDDLDEVIDNSPRLV